MRHCNRVELHAINTRRPHATRADSARERVRYATAADQTALHAQAARPQGQVGTTTRTLTCTTLSCAPEHTVKGTAVPLRCCAAPREYAPRVSAATGAVLTAATASAASVTHVKDSMLREHIGTILSQQVATWAPHHF